MNSSESPGRIANSPHSAKMMNATPQSAYGAEGLDQLVRVHPGRQQHRQSAAAASRAVTGRNGTVADCEFPEAMNR